MTQISFQAVASPDLQSNTPIQEVLGELWAKIAVRLRQGEVLITPEHFLEAMEEEYLSLTGQTVNAAIRRHLRQVIIRVNTSYPETYVARGVQNGVDDAFSKGVRTLRWNEAKIQANGTRSIRRFTQHDRIHDLLDEINVRPSQIDALECIKHSLKILEEKPGSAQEFVRKSRPGPATSAPQAPAKPVVIQPPEVKLLKDPEVQAAIELGDVDEDEARIRLRQQTERRSQLQEQEREKVDEHLHVYVAQGTLTQEEADKVRALRQVDKQQKDGDIDAAKADSARNRILGEKERRALEKKIDQAVDQVVSYQQVFEGMQKIRQDGDDALEFLIRHKETVIAEKPTGAALLKVIQELSDEEPLLSRLIDLVDRKDHEIRMMSVRLPPYNYVMSRGREKISNMTIEVGFIDQLRHLSSDQIVDQLNSPDPEVRVRPAADMRCLIALVDGATRRTRFRKEVRMVRLKNSIEEFYRSTTDVQEARHQAEQFLKRSLRRLFPDMPREEVLELRQESQALIDSVEKKVLEERRRELEAQRLEAEQNRPQGPPEREGELELTEDEERKGIQIARVLIRVAGNYRPVPQRIMPDPDDPEQYVIAVRDEETGELKPQIRRGVKRVVARDRDGLWRLV